MKNDELDLEQLNKVLGGVSFDDGLDSFMESDIPSEEKKAKLEEMREQIAKMGNNQVKKGSKGK